MRPVATRSSSRTATMTSSRRHGHAETCRCSGRRSRIPSKHTTTDATTIRQAGRRNSARLSRFGHVQAKPRRRPPRALSRAWPLRTGHATTAGPHRTSTRTTEYRALTSQFIYSRMARSHARCFRFAPPPRRISTLNRALALNRCSPSSSRHRQLNRIHRRVYCSNAYNHLTNTAHLQTAAN